MARRVAQSGVVFILISALFGISLQGLAQPQPGTQPPVAESLSYIAQLFVKQTLAKFDAVLVRNRLATGKITNAELAFRLDTGESRLLKTTEIGALLFERGRVSILLQTGERLYGQLLTDVEITLLSLQDHRITFNRYDLHADLGIIVLSDQLQRLSNEEFQGLLTRFLMLITRADIVVFQNDAILSGLVVNQVFQLDEFYFNKQEIAEIIFGPLCQLRDHGGRVIVGTMRTPAVTVELLNPQTRFEFATQQLARILFMDRTVTFSRAAAIAERLLPGDEDPQGRPKKP